MSLAAFLLTLVCGASADDYDRRLGAIVGAALADAAAMPLHWIYNTATIDAKLGKGGSRTDPAFFPTPSCPFYNYPLGENTPYGQQNRVILGTLAKLGHFDPIAVQDSYWSFYGPDGAPCHKQQGGLSHEGCYWDGSTKGFVANYQKGLRWPSVGANDTQANALVHMVPLVALLSGGENKSFMLSEVDSLIRITQNTDDAVAFGLAGARILSRVIQGDSLRDAVAAVAKILQDPKREHAYPNDLFLAKGLEKVLARLDWPNFDVVKEVGQSCDYPYNLLSGSHLAAQLNSLAADDGSLAFMLAMRQTIEAGGDSASRGNYVGALFGAAAGEANLPTAWKKHYLHYDTVLADAKKLLHEKISPVILHI